MASGMRLTVLVFGGAELDCGSSGGMIETWPDMEEIMEIYG